MSKASLAGLFALPFLALAQAEPVISIVSMPASPIVETRGGNHFINFDMVVKNESDMMLRICLQRETNANERETNLHRLPDDCDYQVSTLIAPRFYDTKTPLVLPLKGRVLVWEGHDFYAHHVRIPLSDRKVKALGILADSNNFAADFVYTDDAGRYYRGDPRHIENWYGYGKPIYAPGAGTVIAAANDIPDNWFIDERATEIGHPEEPAGKDPDDIGNFVLIDHGNGEYSLLVHMKPGSVRVTVGEHVAVGQPVGQIGFAGDAIFPHLHYSLCAVRTSPRTGEFRLISRTSAVAMAQSRWKWHGGRLIPGILWSESDAQLRLRIAAAVASPIGQVGVDAQAGRAVQSSHLPFALAAPLNI